MNSINMDDFYYFYNEVLDCMDILSAIETYDDEQLVFLYSDHMGGGIYVSLFELNYYDLDCPGCGDSDRYEGKGCVKDIRQEAKDQILNYAKLEKFFKDVNSKIYESEGITYDQKIANYLNCDIYELNVKGGYYELFKCDKGVVCKYPDDTLIDVLKFFENDKISNNCKACVLSDFRGIEYDWKFK